MAQVLSATPTQRSEPQRRQLCNFLKSCRARLSPAQAGLPERGRRRTSGLRREDVAALTGVSVTWYTWLEQGRKIHVSTSVLERLSSSLRLSEDERQYLFSLVQGRPAPSGAGAGDEPSPIVARMLNQIAVPAIVMTARWDVVAWNPLTRIFRDYDRLPPERRNLLRILLIEDATYRQDRRRYEETARRALSKFRVDYGQAREYFAFDELIAQLTSECPIFRKVWRSQDVKKRIEGVARYPQLGGLAFEPSSYVPEGNPMLRLVIYVPADEPSRFKVAEFRRRLSRARAARV
jgi:transcriptional regulator with XRE-family HTH domain